VCQEANIGTDDGVGAFPTADSASFIATFFNPFSATFAITDNITDCLHSCAPACIIFLFRFCGKVGGMVQTILREGTD
jgi:hypothetical protein